MSNKTWAEMDRLEMELNAIENARSMMRYLGFGPPGFMNPGNSWKRHCEELYYKLGDELRRGEYYLNHPH